MPNGRQYKTNGTKRSKEKENKEREREQKSDGQNKKENRKEMGRTRKRTERSWAEQVPKPAQSLNGQILPKKRGAQKRKP